MQSFKKPTKRTALITGVAGAAVLGAVAFGGAAYADGMPSRSWVNLKYPFVSCSDETSQGCIAGLLAQQFMDRTVVRAE